MKTYPLRFILQNVKGPSLLKFTNIYLAKNILALIHLINSLVKKKI